MSLRVRIRLGKGAALNLGKRGLTSLSLTLLPGLTLNLNPNGVMATLSARGTGVSYQTKRVAVSTDSDEQ